MIKYTSGWASICLSRHPVICSSFCVHVFQYVCIIVFISLPAYLLHVSLCLVYKTLSPSSLSLANSLCFADRCIRQSHRTRTAIEKSDWLIHNSNYNTDFWCTTLPSKGQCVETLNLEQAFNAKSTPEFTDTCMCIYAWTYTCINTGRRALARWRFQCSEEGKPT